MGFLKSIWESLPTRERELKPRWRSRWSHRWWSLPTRERELKLDDPAVVGMEFESLPTRERELKRAEALVPIHTSPVAPYTGA